VEVWATRHAERLLGEVGRSSRPRIGRLADSGRASAQTARVGLSLMERVGMAARVPEAVASRST